MISDDRPTFGFPIVVARAADGDARDHAEVVQIRSGLSSWCGVAPLHDPSVATALALHALPVHAAPLLGKKDLHQGWSISEDFLDRRDLLVGASAQLAGLLSMAAAPDRGLSPLPGALHAGLIWTTGCIREEDSTLCEVREDDFPIKLKAFLGSPELLFIAPDLNWARLEGSASRELLGGLAGVWTVPELRKALCDPGFGWDMTGPTRRRYGVRVGPNGLHGLLNALFANVPTFTLASAEAKIHFGDARDRLTHRPADPARIDAFFRAASELHDWEYAVDVLLAILRERSGTAALALRFARTTQSLQPRKFVAEPLWSFALHAAPESDEAQRALIEIHREERDIERLLPLLRARGRSEAVAPVERVSLLEEAATYARGCGDRRAALDDLGRALHLQPTRADLARLTAQELGVLGDDVPLEEALLGLPDAATRAIVLVTVASEKQFRRERRWQALQSLVTRLSRSEASASVDVVVSLGLVVAPTPKALMELSRQVPKLREALLAHYCRTASTRPADATLARILRTWITVTCEVQPLSEALVEHGAREALVRVTTDLALDRTQPEVLRRQALEHAFGAISGASEDLSKYLYDAVRKFASEEASAPLLAVALACSRTAPAPSPRREVIHALLRTKDAAADRIALLTELGGLEETAGRSTEAFRAYYDAVKLGALPNDLAAKVDRTAEAGLAANFSPQECVTTAAFLLEWEPTLQTVRWVLDGYSLANCDWERLVWSKTFRAEHAASPSERVVLFWEVASLLYEKLHSRDRAIQCCEQILAIDVSHIRASQLLRKLRPPPDSAARLSPSATETGARTAPIEGHRHSVAPSLASGSTLEPFPGSLRTTPIASEAPSPAPRSPSASKGSATSRSPLSSLMEAALAPAPASVPPGMPGSLPPRASRPQVAVAPPNRPNVSHPRRPESELPPLVQQPTSATSSLQPTHAMRRSSPNANVAQEGLLPNHDPKGRRLVKVLSNHVVGGIAAEPNRDEVEAKIRHLITLGNDSVLSNRAERFVEAAELVLVCLGEVFRAASLYAHAQIEREFPRQRRAYLDRSEYAIASTAPIAGVAATLVRFATEPNPSRDPIRPARVRAVARFLRERAKDEVGAAFMLFQLATEGDANEECLHSLADALRTAEVRQAIKRQWCRHVRFREVLRQMLVQSCLPSQRGLPNGKKSADTHAFAGLIFDEMMDEPAEAIANYGRSMCADPSKTDVRASLLAVGRRSDLLSEVVDAYHSAMAQHGTDAVETELRLELAVVRLAARQITEARAAVASVKVSHGDDQRHRNIVRAVRSNSPPTGDKAWSLLQ